MKLRLLLACALVVAVMAPSIVGASSGRTEAREYIAIATDEPHTVVCRRGIHEEVPVVPDGSDIGGACFGIGTETTLDLSVADDDAASILVRYVFDQPGVAGVWGHFCDSADDIPVPADATSLQVLPSYQMVAPGATPLCPGAKRPTTGTVTAHWE